ncbi:hypothetical protein E4U13_004854 [Claviceps humidiphila]|uniref:BTB domain-containing protein n=1 Tax=Claviceps humidiphila TaxID=1294629 RepID=A0A9P7PYB0_9HYPO|nr:hypothetical protein E4U13_004854 [Claviceps humidiphila]
MNNTINMKASVYEEIITFKPFKFVVGKERKEVYMHSALVARWSRVLDKMMSSPFIEGQQGFAVLADEDVRTVAAFAEFVYTGDYHLPSVEAPLDSKTEHGGTESHDTSDCRDSDKVLGRPLNNHWTAFATSEDCGHKLDAPSAPAPPSVPLAPVLNPGSMRTDYSEFFIAHAKVFAFADCYGIDALMNLSMRRLHQALCGFRLSKTRVGDILALVRFCYERPGPEKLKRLVASYSAAIMDPGVSNLMPDCFQQLLKERGDFAADMAWFLASRAAGSTKC